MAFHGYIKQGSTPTFVFGPFLDDTDGKTPETGLTIAQADVRLSKNAGAFAQINEATSASHMETGYYSKAANATDTNTLGFLAASVIKAGAIPVRQDYLVITADEWDRMQSTTGALITQGIKARGTTQSSTATGAVLASGETLPDNIVIGDVIALEVSANNWITRSVLDNALTGDTVTYDTMDPAPTGAVRYMIFAGAPASASEKASDLVAMVAANRNDAIQMLVDGITMSSGDGAGTMTVKDSTGATVTITITRGAANPILTLT